VSHCFGLCKEAGKMGKKFNKYYDLLDIAIENISVQKKHVIKCCKRNTSTAIKFYLNRKKKFQEGRQPVIQQLRILSKLL
jgi:hypothetical protein